MESRSKKHTSANFSHSYKHAGRKAIDKRQKMLGEIRLAEKSLNEEGRKCVSIDCEMVGTGERGRRSELARCSIVDVNGDSIMDEYVKPRHEITDYRTRYSGIRPRHMKQASRFKSVRRRVERILRGSLLVGHALHHDLGVLELTHPQDDIRDTSRCKRLRSDTGMDEYMTPSLKRLVKHHLNYKIQNGEHSSVEDAAAAMKLYRTFEQPWEVDLKLRDTDWLGDECWPESISNSNSRCPSDEDTS